jgi:L-threonylcarbamoyladenylate synthase
MTIYLTASNLAEAAAILLSGQPVAIPTETVYGLAAPIFDLEAVQKIFSMKGRPQDNPLIAHVSSIAMVESIAQNIPQIFYELAEKFWPGPLTMVLQRKECVPDLVTAGEGSVAIRMPSHPIALQLIERVGVPLVAPSANLSGRPSPTCVAHVLEDFEGILSAVVEGGSCQIGIESTVLNLLSEIPTLLRPGSISKMHIEEIIGLEIALPKKGGPVLSPGMKYRHYAPKGQLYLTEEILQIPAGSFILSREPFEGFDCRSLNSRELYAHLREADRLQVKEIWVLLDPVSSEDPALMNRLVKAASKL